MTGYDEPSPWELVELGPCGGAGETDWPRCGRCLPGYDPGCTCPDVVTCPGCEDCEGGDEDE